MTNKYTGVSPESMTKAYNQALQSFQGRGYSNEQVAEALKSVKVSCNGYYQAEDTSTVYTKQFTLPKILCDLYLYTVSSGLLELDSSDKYSYLNSEPHFVDNNTFTTNLTQQEVLIQFLVNLNFTHRLLYTQANAVIKLAKPKIPIIPYNGYY